MLFLVRLPQWLLVPQWYSWSWQWPCKMQPFRFSRRASGKRARSCQSVTRRPPMPPRCSAPVPVRARMTDSLSHQVRKEITSEKKSCQELEPKTTRRLCHRP
ncbi:uncharacterized protein LOC135122861 isoform X3 [Zophobas morio]|uniref:uncharacterized protein LOC135122861 isoform X3 n=1 Tax=Zophobas morio TaxID=2755281 RepID=UPI0030839034